MDMSILEGLETEGQRLKDEIQELRHTTTALKTELEQLWADERNVEYELSSVFIHRGSSPSFGHYFFYGRDLPDNPDRWLKYNDQDVSTINKAEVFADTTGSTANPYLVSMFSLCPHLPLSDDLSARVCAQRFQCHENDT